MPQDDGDERAEHADGGHDEQSPGAPVGVGLVAVLLSPAAVGIGGGEPDGEIPKARSMRTVAVSSAPPLDSRHMPSREAVRARKPARESSRPEVSADVV